MGNYLTRLYKLSRKVILYWIIQVSLPIISFFISLDVPEGLKKFIILIGLALPLLVVLPINIIMLLLKQRKKEKELIRRYKSVYQSLAHISKITDEFHRIDKIRSTYKIIKSDVLVENIIQGVNAHPEGKQSTFFNFLSASDAPEISADVEVFDNLTKKRLTTDSSLVGNHVALHSVMFTPKNIGEQINLKIIRRSPGSIVLQEEYIFTILSSFIRGVGQFGETVIFDRRPDTYWVTTIEENGDIERLNIKLPKLKLEKKKYILNWRIENPPNILILNFRFPKKSLFTFRKKKN